MTPYQDIGLIIALLAVFILIMQERHYSFLMRKVKAESIETVQEDVKVQLGTVVDTMNIKLHNFDIKFNELDDYKNKVDALMLKAGFKL